MAKTKAGKGVRYSSGNINQLPLLQDRLTLNRYLCQLLGCQGFRGLREALRDQKEGWAEDGHSYFFRVLEGCEI